MQVAVYAQRGALEVREQALVPPGPGEILVDVHACGICGSDLHAIAKGWPKIGQTLGHEFAGIVSQIGGGVDCVAVGDRVAVIPSAPCGHCAYCTADRENLCTDLTGSSGGFAEQVLLPAGSAVFPLPDEIRLEEAALLEPLAVAVRAVRAATPTAEQRCLVVGLGAIGLCVVQVLRTFGVSMVIAADLSERRLAIAKATGASHLINPTVRTTTEQLVELVGGGVHRDHRYADVDIVFECSGSPGVVSEMITHYVRPSGRVIMVALFEDEVQFDANPLVRKEVTLEGSYAYNREDCATAAELLRARYVDLSPLISHVVPLSKINDAIAFQSDAHNSVKVVVSPDVLFSSPD